jgi:hypothetical protein
MKARDNTTAHENKGHNNLAGYRVGEIPVKEIR